MSDNSRSAYHEKRQIIEYLPYINPSIMKRKEKKKKKRKNEKNGRKKRKRKRGMDGTRGFLLIIYIHII